MEKQRNQDQIIIVLCTIALLIVAVFFDICQDWLTKIAGSTFQSKYIFLRLWSVPVAVLLFSVCWLVLFRFMINHNTRIIATFFLVIGICILFYPSIVITFGISSKLGIPVNYFGNSAFFYSSALVAAIGSLGLLVGMWDSKGGPPEPEIR